MNRTAQRALFYFAVSMLLGLAMISGESLWIDEGQTIHFAKQPTFAAWLDTLRHNIKSEAQMPLGMWAFWAGSKAFGTREWAFRALNLPWVGLAGMAVGLTGFRLKLRGLLLVFLLHPFLWFYANEARPYAMQICAGAWLLHTLVKWHTEREVKSADLWLFGIAAIIGFGSSLLFAFPLAASFAMAGWFWLRGRIQWPKTSKHLWPAVVTLAVLGLLALYYAYTLTKGAKGAKIWSVSPLNLGFSLYEALGFSGLGPPRNELRDLGRTPARLLHALISEPRYFVGLGGLAVLYFGVGVRFWKLRGEPLVRWLVAMMALTVVTLCAAASVMHFPFWGRHFAGALPVIVLLVVKVLTNGTEATSNRRGQVASWLLVTALLVSSLRLRFDPDYRKDDYRTAARLARGALASGKVVWWSADPDECAEYYGLTQGTVPQGSARLIWIWPRTADELTRQPAPDVIFQSKPDVFDDAGHLRAYLAAGQYTKVRQLPAFNIWVRPDQKEVFQ